MKTWRIGVVSATGFCKSRHLPIYREMPNIELAACCDLNEAALNETCDQFGIPGRHTQLESMLEDPSLEIIVVVIRPERHIPVSRRCVEAGKHVLVEKPLSEDYREILAFRDFLAGRREKVMVSQNYRFQDPALTMAELVAQGDLGEPYWAELIKYCSSVDRDRPVTDSPRYKSQYINIGIHDIDQLRAMFPGREAEWVFAPPVRIPHAAVKYPFTEVQIQFRGGLHALARMDWATVGLNAWTTLRVEGTRAAGRCVYTDSADIVLESQDAPPRRVGRPQSNDIRNVMTHFTQCLEQGHDPVTSVADNVRTMEILLAAYVSCREGKVVHFPEVRERLAGV